MTEHVEKVFKDFGYRVADLILADPRIGQELPRQIALLVTESPAFKAMIRETVLTCLKETVEAASRGNCFALIQAAAAWKVKLYLKRGELVAYPRSNLPPSLLEAIHWNKEEIITYLARLEAERDEAKHARTKTNPKP